jgi:hypothetical protein
VAGAGTAAGADAVATVADDAVALGVVRSTIVPLSRVGIDIITPAAAAPARDVSTTDAISVVFIVSCACLWSCRHGTAHSKQRTGGV